MQTGTADIPEARWHELRCEEALERLSSSADGLSPSEAGGRLAVYGPNLLTGAPPVSALKLLLEEFRSPLVVVLIAAAAVLVAVSQIAAEPGQLVDAILIGLIVLLNAGLGFSQNYRASRGIESLNRLAAPSATVLRGGVAEAVDAGELVPGDVVLLEEGSRVPADGRLLSSIDLSADESALTGESVAVSKQSEPVAGNAALADRLCMAYSGTVVMRGRGRLLVTATGMRTEVGHIAREVQAAGGEPTVYQREVSRLAGRIGWIVAGLIAVVVVLQLLRGGLGLLETFITAVALAVAAVPEGLPVVLTLALAFGTRRMLERKALVRALPVVEIVGAAEVICTDKTGTVTQGRMTVRRVSTFTDELDANDVSPGDNPEPIGLTLLTAGLCNNAQRHPEHGYVGDPTETALLEFADRAEAPLPDYRRTAEIPFSSERRMMSVVVARNGEDDGLLLAKGAPEAVLPLCTGVLTAAGVEALTQESRDSQLQKTQELAGEALRVLACAYRRQSADAPASEQDLVFIGLTAMSDPPRPEAAQAIESAQRAGIRVVMITGDNRLTAAAIGREVGLPGDAMEARELDALDEDDLKQRVNHTSIFARAEPRHKVMILRALKEDHEVVLMTGDGVNDAPALRNADVGVAMGMKGTDVARDTSDMVLLDDNLATIIAAVEEGRRIFRNIKKFVNYMLTGNLAEVLVILVATAFGHLPVTAVQILWINLVTDSGPAVALASDPSPQGAMREPPRHGPVLGSSMAALVLGIGLVVAAILVATFFIGLWLWDLQTARTMTFTGLVVQEYLRLLVIRVQEGMPPLANGWLWTSVSVSLVLQVIIIYTPIGSAAFDTAPLGLEQWGILAAGLAAGFVATLITGKLVVRRFGQL